MNKILIQPNYNNVAVKLPTSNNIPSVTIAYNPQTISYTITINPNIDKEDYCYLTITLDNKVYDTVKINNPYSFNIVHISGIITISLSGYYMTDCYKQNFTNIEYFLTTNTICSETTICSEETYCNNIEEE